MLFFIDILLFSEPWINYEAIFNSFNEFYAELLKDRPDLWLYPTIPLTAGIVGWLTNYLAIKMMFYPIEFYGWTIGKIPVGWQGIIPSRAVEMSETAVDLMVGKLIKVEDQFERLDPERVYEEIAPRLNYLARQTVDETMKKEMPLVWRLMSKSKKEEIYKDAEEAMPGSIEGIMDDIKENVEELFDVKAMVVNNLSNDKSLLNSMFLECGKEEFKFIERSGFYFGFLFGIGQMIVWFFWQSWWILPLGGLLVGYVTNWLALKLIFEPLHPVKLGNITLQGLFIKRQKEVAEVYAAMVAEKVFTVENVVNEILTGKGKDRLHEILQKHVYLSIDKAAGFNRSLIQLSSGTKTYANIKAATYDSILSEFPATTELIFDYAEEALAIEDTMREKMSNLTPEEFEGFLRPVFQADEWKLILIGAGLGYLAGWMQAVFFISDELIMMLQTLSSSIN